MGVVKSALAGTRLSCRDDTDFFFTMLFLTGVNYEHDCDTADAADCMPALLFVNDAIPVRHDIRIFEDPCRSSASRWLTLAYCGTKPARNTTTSTMAEMTGLFFISAPLFEGNSGGLRL